MASRTFILYFGLQFNTALSMLLLTLFRLWPCGSSFCWFLQTFVIPPVNKGALVYVVFFVCFLSTSLLSSTTRCSRLFLYFCHTKKNFPVLHLSYRHSDKNPDNHRPFSRHYSFAFPRMSYWYHSFSHWLFLLAMHFKIDLCLFVV